MAHFSPPAKVTPQFMLPLFLIMLVLLQSANPEFLIGSFCFALDPHCSLASTRQSEWQSNSIKGHVIAPRFLQIIQSKSLKNSLQFSDMLRTTPFLCSVPATQFSGFESKQPGMPLPQRLPSSPCSYPRLVQSFSRYSHGLFSGILNINT